MSDSDKELIAELRNEAIGLRDYEPDEWDTEITDAWESAGALLDRAADALFTAAVRYRREAVTECAEIADGFGIIGGGGDDTYWTGYNDATVSVAAALRALLDENNETQDHKKEG